MLVGLEMDNVCCRFQGEEINPMTMGVELELECGGVPGGVNEGDCGAASNMVDEVVENDVEEMVVKVDFIIKILLFSGFWDVLVSSLVFFLSIFLASFSSLLFSFLTLVKLSFRFLIVLSWFCLEDSRV